MALSTWLAFLLAAILIAVSPGPGAATSMSVGLRHGYWAALRAIGVKHFVMEHDNPSDHKRFATRAIASAKGF